MTPLSAILCRDWVSWPGCEASAEAEFEVAVEVEFPSIQYGPLLTLILSPACKVTRGEAL